MSDGQYLSIGEVLGLLLEDFPDVTISKIRFLESQGLIEPERTPSGYRKFYDHDVDLLRAILHEQRENFLPLKVIRDRIESGSLEGDPTGGRTPPRGIRNVEVRNGASSVTSGSNTARSNTAQSNRAHVVETSQVATTHDPRDSVFRRTDGGPEWADGRALIPGSQNSPTSSVPPPITASVPITMSMPITPLVPQKRTPVGPLTGSPTSVPTGSHPTGSHPTTHPTTHPAAFAASGGDPATPLHLAGMPSNDSFADDSASDNSSAKDSAAKDSAAKESAKESVAKESVAKDSVAKDSAPKDSAPKDSAAKNSAAKSSPAESFVADDPPTSSVVGGIGAGKPGPGVVIERTSKMPYNREEFCAAAHITLGQLDELESYGLIGAKGTGRDATYSADALEIATVAGRFLANGIDARHLRSWKQSADRESALFEQRIMPLLRQRNPASRHAALDTLTDLSGLGGRLRQALVDAALRHHFDGV